MLARFALFAAVIAAAAQATSLYTISGRVQDAHGRLPPRSVLSVCSARDDGVSGCEPVQLSDEGHFTTPRKAPGTYVLNVGPPMSLGHDDPSIEGGLAVVQLGAAHVTDVSIVTSAYTLRGRFVTPAGAPLVKPPSQLHVLGELVLGDRSYAVGARTAIAESDGGFTISNLFGRRVLRAGYISNPGHWRFSAVRLDGQDITDAPTDFSRRPNARLEVVFSEDPPSQLEGTVTDAAGNVASGAWVVLFSADPALWTHWASTTSIQQTVSEGRFSQPVRPGRYLVAAIPPTAYQMRPVVPPFAKLAEAAIAVTVGEGGRSSVALRLRP